jgi:uroporphyrinogen decarboxylase
MSELKNILLKKNYDKRPIWFMRQAGRYLPEFKKIRSSNKNFIDLCLNSNLSTEITLQPINRFSLDAAIIFSDILLIPYALGQKVEFIKNQGPTLNNFDINIFSKINKDFFTQKLKPIYKAIEKTRIKLHKEKSLIAFVGAPWTLLIYMLSLKVDKNKIDLLKLKNNVSNIRLILNKLTDFVCDHIYNQMKAGADVVQIFDSWAGLIPQENLLEFCYNPNLKIVNFCKKNKFPVICFPKGLGEKYLEFNNHVKSDGLNIDYEIDPVWAKENLIKTTLQGGMNPQALLQSDNAMYTEASKYLEAFKHVPYIFNLGHGIVPETNPEKLGKLINFVKNYK